MLMHVMNVDASSARADTNNDESKATDQEVCSEYWAINIYEVVRIEILCGCE